MEEKRKIGVILAVDPFVRSIQKDIGYFLNLSPEKDVHFVIKQ
ncbi:MAG: hypothetical protein BAJALOKI2v1_340022 [Promethearchaeota archaeon]|nr:MAG: hypothetical protein BAJALOKI2v1_340022 [Candidatus Lokiarchaeota archaeon]